MALEGLIIIYGYQDLPPAKLAEIPTVIQSGAVVHFQVPPRDTLQNPEWSGNQSALFLLGLNLPSNRVLVTFSGWDSDPREVFQIPEIQRWCVGFLGRVVAYKTRNGQIRLIIQDEKPGDWEGKILDLLLMEDPGFGSEESSGSQFRIFGTADQLLDNPRVKWTKSTPTRWYCDPTEALQVIEGLIRNKNRPSSPEKQWGMGRSGY